MARFAPLTDQVGFRTVMFYFDKKIIDKIEWHVVNVQETNSCENNENAKEIMLLLFDRYKLGIDTEKSQNNNKNCQFQVVFNTVNLHKKFCFAYIAKMPV